MQINPSRSISRPWTSTEIDFLRSNYMRMTAAEIGLTINRTPASIRRFASLIGVSKMSKLSEHEKSFIRHNFMRITTRELSEILGRPVGTIDGFALREGLRKDPDFVTETRQKLHKSMKGREPANKGKKMRPEQLINVRKAGLKRRGRKPATHKPVGYEYISTRGMVMVKVSDIPYAGNQNWKPKHRFVWEQEYGPIPKGMVLIFLDGNQQNCSIENLAALNRQQVMKLHSIHRYPEEIKKAFYALGFYKRGINYYAKKQDGRS